MKRVLLGGLLLAAVSSPGHLTATAAHNGRYVYRDNDVRSIAYDDPLTSEVVNDRGAGSYELRTRDTATRQEDRPF